MPLLESAKKIAEQVTGIGRPGKRKASEYVRARKPNLYRFRDDGRTPNNSLLPLVVYLSPVRFSDGLDPAAIFEDLFASHGWDDSWRNGIYDFLHFHTQTHEVLGIARGRTRVQFGGEKGRSLVVKAGDVIVLPAGTGHRRLGASDDLLVVGAYPQRGKYDEPRPEDIEHEKALARIRKVRVPSADPVYGKDGPLMSVWKSN